MSDRSNVIYCYDGSFDGLMCCVFDSYTRKEVPSDIVTKENQQLTFNEVHDVITDEAHADRILRSIPKKWAKMRPISLKKRFFQIFPNVICIYSDLCIRVTNTDSGSCIWSPTAR